MKKTITALMFIVAFISIKSQTNAFNELRQNLTKLHPEIDLNEKLMAFVISSNDQDSITNNSFEKVQTVYDHAILKGGRKGIIVLKINSMAELSECPEINKTGFSNAVYDASGQLLFSNLKGQNVYESVRKLITR